VPILLLALLASSAPLTIPARAAAAPASARDQLAKVLRSAKDYKQRIAAVIGLARLNDRRAVPALVEALRDPQGTVRGTAAGALGKLGDEGAAHALESLLARERDPFVVKSAQSALAALLRDAAPAARQPPRSSNEMEVAGTTGTLDGQAAEDGVNARLPRVADCYTRARSAAPFLAGRLDLKLRVTTAGKVRWVRLERSDLGSLAVEQCILATLGAAAFSAPEGGEAEFKIPIALDPQSIGILPASSPPADGRVPAEAKKLLKGCKKLLRPADGAALTPPAGLLATLYIDPDGAVLSVGLSAPGGQLAPEIANTLVARLKAAKMPPRDDGHIIKVVTPFACPR
jgi:hypothetical protein